MAGRGDSADERNFEKLYEKLLEIQAGMTGLERREAARRRRDRIALAALAFLLVPAVVMALGTAGFVVKTYNGTSDVSRFTIESGDATARAYFESSNVGIGGVTAPVTPLHVGKPAADGNVVEFDRFNGDRMVDFTTVDWGGSYGGALGAVNLEARPATAGSTTRASPTILWRGRYWDGAASQNRDFFVTHVVQSAPAYTGRLVVGSPTAGEYWSFNNTGEFNLGRDDAGGGILQAFGNATGSAEGGEIRLFTAADWDTTYQHYRIDTWQDHLRIAREGIGDDIFLTKDGNVGIGTGSPGAKFQVGNGTAAAGVIIDDNVTGGASPTITQAAANAVFGGAASNADGWHTHSATGGSWTYVAALNTTVAAPAGYSADTYQLQNGYEYMLVGLLGGTDVTADGTTALTFTVTRNLSGGLYNRGDPSATGETDYSRYAALEKFDAIANGWTVGTYRLESFGLDTPSVMTIEGYFGFSNATIRHQMNINSFLTTYGVIYIRYDGVVRLWDSGNTRDSAVLIYRR